MGKEIIINKIDLLIARLNNPNNSVYILKPLVQDIYRIITGNTRFSIGQHLTVDLGDSDQQIQREQMIQLLEALKEQYDIFSNDSSTQEEDEGPAPIGFKLT